MRSPDAVVVGSGPNGLAAALTLARAGMTVEVLEGAGTPGGGCRTEELTAEGFLHDVCSAVHPLLAASPFFATVDTDRHTLELLAPKVAFAHPLDTRRGAAVYASVDETASRLGADASTYKALVSPLVRNAREIMSAVLAPLRKVPARPLPVARFALTGLAPVQRLAKRFERDEARALLAGAAAHAMLPFSRPLTSSYALLFTMLAHTTRWPVVRGGSARITDALADELESLGGSVKTGIWVEHLDELPQSRLVMLDVSVPRLLELAAGRLPTLYRRSLEHFAYGPGVCKVDWALDGEVPWSAQDCREAGTVHLGGTFEEIALSESEVSQGRHPERPYCIVAQPGVVDPSRAPVGANTLWAYCHVPSGSSFDMTERIEAQIERFAPGFRDTIVARATRTASELEHHDPNYVGGDVNGGSATLTQTLFRPSLGWDNYRTPLEGVYLCSASTPPGGGVHGMCGFNAASSALSRLGVHPQPALAPAPVVEAQHER